MSSAMSLSDYPLEDTAGRLRVTAPVTLAETLLGEVVAECLARHPQMRLELVLTDRHVDLVEEKFDLAFRTGTLKGISVVAHELGRGQRCFASREYLRDRGTPRTPRDLRRHDCILFSPLAPRGRWTFRSRVVPWRSRCADGSSLTASRSRSTPRREGSALPAFQERSSSKGLRPINWSRCSTRTCPRRSPSMLSMPAAFASHPLRERSSRSPKGN